VDGYGYVYVSDMFSNNIWQIVPGPSNGIGSGPNTGAPFTTSSTGMRTVAWANPSGTAGSDNGPSATATFNFPSGIAADAYGDLFVVEGTTRHDFDVEVAAKFSTLQSLFNQSAIGFDFGTNTVRLIRAGDVTPDGITSGGQVSILAGRAGISGSSDGTGEGASVQLSAPQGAAVDQAGNVYVADNGNRSVRKITPAGVATILADGFQNVLDVAVDAQQNVYVADSGYDVQFGSIFRVTPDGTKTLLFSGQDIFAGEKSWIMNPLGLTVDPAGNIFFTTPLGGIFELAAPLTSGMTPIPVLADYRSTTPTIRPAGGAGMGATFVGIAAASTTQLYVADVYDNNVQSVSLGETGWSATVLAGGDATNPGFADSISGSAFFNHPTRLAWDQDGNSLYVYDAGNNAIRQINVGGLNPVTTVVNGSGRMGNLAGDVAATAGLASPLMPAFTTSIAGFSTMNFLGGLNAQMPTTVYATGPYYWGLAVDPTSLVGARRLIITVPDAVLKAQF